MYKVFFITFGCKVNQYETQCMKELFAERGFTAADSPSQAEVIVINSCTVTSSGDSRALTSLRKMRELRPDAVIALTGCYPQANAVEAAKVTGADIVCGTKDRSRLPELVLDFCEKHCRIVELSPYAPGEPFEPLSCSRYDDNTRAFVKIQDGCDRFCSYCLIPYARGRCRSKSIDLLREEAFRLAQSGKKEIVITGINLAFYRDPSGADMADAAKVCAVTPGIERVRLGSLEPEMMTPDTLRRLAELPQFCPQFHLSLQSGCDRTLKAMNRRYSAEDYLSLVENIRSHFPDCSFTTDVMVGFPGETDDDHRQSMELVEKVGFAKVHVFRYSPRPGTPAAGRTDQIPEMIKSARWKEMSETAGRCREKYLSSLVGKTLPVLFERENSTEFHQGHAPDYTPIKIFRKNPEKSLRNRIISVIIEEYTHDGCVGRPVNDLEYDII